ncbi:uncharacterized protein LOC117321705 [Pecten maximus]|uniref:uncharacterized protein LOC117321705 n=1 Tax=Pecten maximus TaxID=6579 RepID=UPI00145832DD|nr:uncharacterized protein LOC117321705 [Pecten maximus]
MHRLFGYLFLVAIIFIPLFSAKDVNKKRVKHCCTERNTSYSCEFLELSCPSGYVIYKPDVYPSSLSCRNGHICHGVEIPYTDLRVDILNCHWKNKCLIDPSSIRRSFQFVLENKCSSRKWRNILVKDWKCVQKAAITDICSENKMHSINIQHRLNKPSGVVRSHERFPWDYDKDIFLIKNSLYAPKCTVTFNGFMLTHKDFSRIAIYVESLDIGDDYNSAYIQEEELMHDKTYTYDFADGPVNITFGLTLTDGEIKGGSGFIIYYKFLKVGETSSSVKELDDVIKTKQGIRATCIHNHQYFCPFRKMCDKKKSKLFVPSDDTNNFCTYLSIRKPGRPRHCLTRERYKACKVPKAPFKKRKWSMIINGNLTENAFTCKWMLKSKRQTWNVTFVSNSIDGQFDNLTVKHYHCGRPNPKHHTVLVPRTIPYTLDEGDVLTVEYSRLTNLLTEPYTWSPPHSDFKMIFERTRKRKREA